MNRTDTLWFGKYKDKPLHEVPAHWMMWYYGLSRMNMGSRQLELIKYIEENMAEISAAAAFDLRR